MAASLRGMTRRQLLQLSLLTAAAPLAEFGCTPARERRRNEDQVEPPAATPSPGPALEGRAPATAESSPSSTPLFSDVSQVGPDEIAQYFAGRHPKYPGASLDNFLGYSPADILESLDTAVLDAAGERSGARAIRMLEEIVARNLLDGLLAVYDRKPVLLALDAGHGGKPGVYYEPGSNGTEAVHTREVVAIVEDYAQDSQYASITIRRIFNDAIGDDFSLPPPEDSKARASLVIRNARASMLAYEANAWNQAHSERPVVVHVVSVHFNANSGGTLVLHQGADVPSDFQRRSVAFGRWYVDHARPALNATGFLPSDLGLVNGNGLHDDSLMYTPPIRAGGSRVNPLTGNALHGPPRYAMLQASLLEQDYVLGLLRYRGLV